MHVVYADIGRTCRTRLRSVPRSRLASPPRGRSFGRSVSLVLLFSCSAAAAVCAAHTDTHRVCDHRGGGPDWTGDHTGTLGQYVCVVLCVRETATFECGEPPRDDGRETFLPPLTFPHRNTLRVRCHTLSWYEVCYGNDPSAGSPTETLLRLLLPLNHQVRSTSAIQM